MFHRQCVEERFDFDPANVGRVLVDRPVETDKIVANFTLHKDVSDVRGGYFFHNIDAVSYTHLTLPTNREV